MQNNINQNKAVIKHYIVKNKDLPLSCPMPGITVMEQWNSHPKVFLPIEEASSHEISCPYCGNSFILDQSDN